MRVTRHARIELKCCDLTVNELPRVSNRLRAARGAYVWMSLREASARKVMTTCLRLPGVEPSKVPETRFVTLCGVCCRMAYTNVFAWLCIRRADAGFQNSFGGCFSQLV
jgi:hypothetical protein